MPSLRRVAPALLILLAGATGVSGCSGEPSRVVLEGGGLAVPVTRLASRGPVDLPKGDRPVGVLIDLRTQVDLEALGHRLSELGLGRAARRRVVVEALDRVAAESRANLETELAALRDRGEVSAYRGFSVVNRVWVEGSARAIEELAGRPEVAAVHPGTVSRARAWATARSEPRTASFGRPDGSWALAAIGADVAHARGLDGRGTVVGVIDSGASAVHEQLAPGFLGPERGWHDPGSGRDRPGDGAYGHGTGVLSTAVGANRNGVVLGVAPGARWAACAALPDGHYDNALMTECADWMLRVAQPDVLINSWFLPEPGCDPSLRRIVDAWRAAEILPVFAVGNEGPETGRDRSPSNYVGLFPGNARALSVGGVGRGDVPFERSTPGPNSCDPGALYPTLVAPARDLVAAIPLTASTYRRVDGTSFGAGLVAGAAAVLLQAEPESSVVELERALVEGAADLGAPGPDPTYGHGRLDLPGALEALARLRGRSEGDGVGAATAHQPSAFRARRSREASGSRQRTISQAPSTTAAIAVSWATVTGPKIRSSLARTISTRKRSAPAATR